MKDGILYDYEYDDDICLFKTNTACNTYNTVDKYCRYVRYGGFAKKWMLVAREAEDQQKCQLLQNAINTGKLVYTGTSTSGTEMYKLKNYTFTRYRVSCNHATGKLVLS